MKSNPEKMFNQRRRQLEIDIAGVLDAISTAVEAAPAAKRRALAEILMLDFAAHFSKGLSNKYPPRVAAGMMVCLQTAVDWQLAQRNALKVTPAAGRA
jgi:hypothetical protein